MRRLSLVATREATARSSGAVASVFRALPPSFFVASLRHLLQIPIEPCSLSGGPLPQLLQKMIQKKQKECDAEIQAALQFLLSLGAETTVAAAAAAEIPAREMFDEAVLEQRMQQALRTIQQRSTAEPQRQSMKLTTVCYLERPAGHVRVSYVVGLVYMELLRRGYDAEAWWRCYYRRFVQSAASNQLAASSEPIAVTATVAAVDVERGATDSLEGGEEGFFDVVANVNAAADSASPPVHRGGAGYIPPFYWAQWRLGGNCRRSSDDGIVRYVTPTFPPSGKGRTKPLSADAAVALRTPSSLPPASTASPYWIPLSLLRHLPFFPVPYPGSRNALPPDDAFMIEHGGDVEDGDGDSVDDDASRFGGQWPSSSAGAQTSDWAAVDSSTPPQNFNWLHPFYDTLFASKQAIVQHAMAGKTLLRQSAAAVHQNAMVADNWLSNRRALLPLKVPWRVAPVLPTATNPDVALTSPSAAKSRAGGRSCPFFLSKGDPTLPSSWPSPLIALKLDKAYLELWSSFWACKASILANLPLPYLFPFTAYPFICAQIRKPTKKGYDGLSSSWAAPTRLLGTTGSSRCDGACINQSNSVPQPSLETTPFPPDSMSDSAFRRGIGKEAFSFFSVALKHDWRMHRVTFFGRGFIPVSCTTLTCLFDSATCVQHAVPLDVFGRVFFSGFHATRHRQQRHVTRSSCNVQVKRRQDHMSAPATVGTAVELPDLLCATERLAAVRPMRSMRSAKAAAADTMQHALPSRSPWLQRLRLMQLRSLSSPRSASVTNGDHSQEMRLSQRGLYFLFRSPYWVEVEGLYERWGVHVAPGVVPLTICSAAYVNAEQTTDASRFTPVTCVPHLQQDALFCDTLLHLSWTVSQQLLSIIAPAAQPRQRGPKAVCAWTYQTLKERAAAVQNVSNLWVADEMVKKMGWSLQPVRTCAEPPTNTILHTQLSVKSVQLKKLRARLEGALAEPPAPNSPQTGAPHLFAPPSQQAPEASQQHLHRLRVQGFVTLFHSSCVAEQDQLAFVAAYAPSVLLTCVPAVTEAELQARTDSLVRAAGTCSVERSKQLANDFLCRTGANASFLRRVRGQGFDVSAGFAFDVDFGSFSSAQGNDVEARHYLAMAKAKCSHYALPWIGAKLTFASRIDLACLALQKGYRPENAQRWVSLDFLRSERRVRQVRRPSQERATASSSVASSTSVDDSVEGDAKALTAIDVKLYVEAQRWKSFLNENESVRLPPLETHTDAENDVDMYPPKLLVVKVTLVNCEELEWSEGILPVDYLMWLEKHL